MIGKSKKMEIYSIKSKENLQKPKLIQRPSTANNSLQRERPYESISLQLKKIVSREFDKIIEAN